MNQPLRLACTLSLLLSALGSQGQDYRPFRPGLLHQLTKAASDSTYGVALEPGGYTLSGTDSSYYFSSRMAMLRPPAGTSTCGYPYFNGWPSHFGFSLRVVKVRGVAVPTYTLEMGTAALQLQPGAPLNQSWAAGPGLTAQVTARAVAPVLGQADSVVTISFSDGRTLRLSKQWGFVDGPALVDYLMSRRTVRQLALTALPTKGLGQPMLGARALYNFQPGDVFWYRLSENTGTTPGPWPPAANSVIYGDSVLSRRVSPRGDTITYRIASGNYQTPRTWQIRTLVVHDNMAPALLRATGRYLPGSATAPSGTYTSDLAPITGQYNGRPVLKAEERYYHCASQPYTYPEELWVQRPVADGEKGAWYAPGLGQVYSHETNTTCCYRFLNLVGYRKVGLPTSPGNPSGTEQWGTLYRFNVLSAAQHRAAATTTAYPNPLAGQLTVRFETQRPQQAAVLLTDALGRPVLRHAQPVAAGATQLTLDLPKLSAGLYTLHLRHDGRTEVLKLTAAP